LATELKKRRKKRAHLVLSVGDASVGLETAFSVHFCGRQQKDLYVAEAKFSYTKNCCKNNFE